MVGQRAPAGGDIRRYLGQRRQHEGPLQHARMRYVEPLLVHGLVAEDENVDVDQPRPPALLADAFELPLRLQAKIEKLAR